MNFRRLLPLLAPTLLLAGCVNEPIGQRDAGFGESVKFNSAVQTINPDPVYAEGGALPGGNGDRATKAVERYREGQVTPVEVIETTSGGGGPQ